MFNVLRFVTVMLCVMSCQINSEVESPKRSANQYFNQLKNDASFRALRDETKSIADKARLSNVEFYDSRPEDLRKLDFASGLSKENLLLNFTNNPRFVINAEDRLRVLLQDFAKHHRDFVKEDPELIDEVYSKLLSYEGDRLILSLKAAKTPDCGGTCNNQFYGSMESCAFNYTVSFAGLIIGMIATEGGGSVAALAGYIIAQAQRSYCESSAFNNLGYCMDGCAGGNNATSNGTEDE
ncbi:hypothetical protein [Dyadobacter arcticus]|uniref:Uncharacterized protein n=1 Tax=Dyadobacter arcticus TaxID=1078754 RepID=A0ABX0UHF0_9BACT|nr:hypothetical protein [Dyadobacter arcticus]NIJ51130.1 hypothetical protein [Dyadobacter arcticus]